MFTARRFLLAALICGLFSECNKEHLQPGTNSGAPVFYFNGTVNGQAVSFAAGLYNYYMFSYFSADNNNVLNFGGSLQPSGCNNCSNSISISIKDFKVESGLSNDSSLVRGYYAFMGPKGGNPTSFSAYFQPRLYTTVIKSIGWDFGDGNSSTSASSFHTYSHPGNYKVMFLLDGICQSAITNPVNVGTPLSALVPRIIITGDTYPDKISMTAAVSGGTQPYRFLWSFGDGSYSGSQSLDHYYANPGMYQIMLTVTDNTGLSTTVSLDTCTYKYSHDCMVNFSSPVYAQNNPNAFSNITITYSDASGNLYSSANVDQPSASYFQVLSVSDYQNNQNNQPTKELKVVFSCLVKDSKGNTIPISNADAVIAVAYQ